MNNAVDEDDNALNHARLFFTDAGAGRGVVFLHGWTCDSHDWSWQLPVFEKRYRVLAVDLRGHGRSAVLPPGNYSPNAYVTDIERLIVTRFPGQRPILIGHSMGAQIAARLAVRRPDLVSAIISVDGTFGYPESQRPLFEQIAADIAGTNPAEVAANLLSNFYDPASDPALRRWHARRIAGMDGHVICESFAPQLLGPLQIGMGERSEAFCHSITVPMLHLCRDQDQARRMQGWFGNPRSHIQVWRDAGHWLMIDRAKDFNAAVVEWIEAEGG